MVLVQHSRQEEEMNPQRRPPCPADWARSMAMLQTYRFQKTPNTRRLSL